MLCVGTGLPQGAQATCIRDASGGTRFSLRAQLRSDCLHASGLIACAHWRHYYDVYLRRVSLSTASCVPCVFWPGWFSTEPSCPAGMPGPLRHPRICTVQTPSGVHVGVAAAISELDGLGLSSQCLFFAHARACLQRASRPLSLSSRHRLELLKQPMWTPSWTRPSTRQLATFRCAEFFGDLPGSAAESNLVVQRCQAEASVVHGYQLRLACMQSFGEILKGLYGKGLEAADYASDVRPQFLNSLSSVLYSARHRV